MAQEGSGQTPEKQLLKLIEDPQGAVQKKEKIKRKGSNLLSWSGLKGRLSFFRSKSRGAGHAGKPPLELRTLNRILVLFILGVGTYLGYQVATGMRGLEDVTFEEAKPAETGLSLAPVDEEVGKSQSYFLEQAAVRDLFDPFINPFVQEDEGARLVKRKPPEKKRAPQVPRIQGLVNKLSLVGIAWSRNPDAMVESVEDQRTHFLKRGDVMDSGLKVEAIFKDYVVFSYEGQEMELR